MSEPTWEQLAKAGDCPICGRRMEMAGARLSEMYVNHQCPAATLRGIDAANSRSEEPMTPAPGFFERLRTGFRMMRDDCGDWTHDT